MYSPLWKSPIKAHRFCVLPPLKNHPSKAIGFVYSPLWKSPIKAHRFCVLPPLKKNCFWWALIPGWAFISAYTVFLTYEWGQKFYLFGMREQPSFPGDPIPGHSCPGACSARQTAPRIPSCNPFASRAAHFSLYSPWYRTRKKIITAKIKIIHVRNQITATEEQKNFAYHPTADLSCRSVCTPNSPPKPPL